MMKERIRKLSAILLALAILVLPLTASAVNVKLVYTGKVSLTCTLTSVTNNTQWGCASVDNTTNLYLDAVTFIQIKTNAAGTSATGTLNVYAYGSADSGTTYSDSVTGTNASQTLTSPPNVKVIGVCNAVANATTYNCGPFEVAQAFGGVLPDKWGIVVENKSGATLDATIGSAWYEGAYASVQ